MRKIHSFLMSIVMSILLTQAVDPPKDEGLTEHQLINRLLQSNGRSQYARLLQREEIQPLLKLYEKSNFTKPSIPEEEPDIFENQGKIDKLLERSDDPQNDQQIQRDVEELLRKYTRRTDFKPSALLSIEDSTKKYDYPPTRPDPFNFQPYDPQYFSPVLEPNRYDPFYEDPRYHRFRGFYRSPRKLPQRDFGPSGREAYFERGISPWKGSWRPERGPRVIFPTDLVSFRDQQEPDFLLGDQSLQELQEPEKEPDRGKYYATGQLGYFQGTKTRISSVTFPPDNTDLNTKNRP